MREGGLSKLIGKTIKSVIIDGDNPRPPREQIYLVFTDGTAFEFFGESFSVGSAVDRRSEERVLQLCGSRGGQVTHLKTPASDNTLERTETVPLGSRLMPDGTWAESVVETPPMKPVIVR